VNSENGQSRRGAYIKGSRPSIQGAHSQDGVNKNGACSPEEGRKCNEVATLKEMEEQENQEKLMFMYPNRLDEKGKA
jgi:hypothetical protein